MVGGGGQLRTFFLSRLSLLLQVGIILLPSFVFSTWSLVSTDSVPFSCPQQSLPSSLFELKALEKAGICCYDSSSDECQGVSSSINQSVTQSITHSN